MTTGSGDWIGHILTATSVIGQMERAISWCVLTQSSMTVEEILRTDHSRASSQSISFAVKEALV